MRKKTAEKNNNNDLVKTYTVTYMNHFLKLFAHLPN